MKMSVLIVDDDLDFAESLAELIQIEGHSSHVSTSGVDAISQYSQKPFDLVLMDMKMPGMNGVEAFNGIRKEYGGAQVAMMTGFAVESQLSEALHNGALEILTKPIQINALDSLLEHTLKKQTVLLVDDDVDFSSSVKEILENKGLRTIVVTGGDEAVIAALHGGFDVLLLDIRLQGNHGLEILEHLKQEGRIIPTIVITAYIEEEGEAVKQFSEEWGVEIMAKPIHPGQLLDSIRGFVTLND